MTLDVLLIIKCCMCIKLGVPNFHNVLLAPRQSGVVMSEFCNRASFLSVNMALYSAFHIWKLKAEKISSCAQRFGGQKSCDVYCYFNLWFVYLCDESVS